MDRKGVFCGCQTYPSPGSGGKSSAWEWGIATPRQKSKRVSQSNPVFPSTRPSDMEAINKRYSDNLYEPVNPPTMHATGSSSAMKDPLETGSLDGRRFEIPPEIDIITSYGLDGLDLPDRHDRGFDGDKEWVHSDEEPSTSISVPQKALFTAGIRQGDAKLPSDSSPRSSIRPLTNKTISFAPDTEEGEEEFQPMEQDIQEVPTSSHTPAASTAQASGGPPKKTTTAFEILKSKAAGAADQVKQRFKIGLPTRQKLSKEEGAKLRRRPRKKVAGELDQEVPEDMEVKEEEGDMEVVAEQEETPATESSEMETEVTEESSAKEIKEEALRKEKEAKEDSQRKEKEAKEEEKLRKQKEQEDLKRQKAEEKQLAKEEAQKKKAEEKLAKQKAADEAKKAAEEAKKVKLEEQLAKAKEAQELKRQKEEEDLKKIREQEAQAKELQEKKRLEEEQRKEEEAKVKAKEAEERKQQEETQRKVREQEAASAAAVQAAATQAAAPEAEVVTEAAAIEVTESTAAQEEIRMEEEETPAEPEQTTSTPTGTGKRKVKKMTFPQMPHLPKMPDLPHIDLDFRKKIIKRSKTPPARPEPPKSKSKKGALETENQLAAQYENEIQARNADLEEEEQAQPATLPEPQIYVTQPSNEALEESETHVEWEPSSTHGGDGEEPSTSKKPAAKERFDKFGKSLKGFGSKSKEVASQKSKAMGQKMKVLGKDLQKFGVKVNEKYQSTIEEIKAKQEAAKARSKQKAKEAEDVEEQMEFEGEYPESSTEPRRTFRFRRRDESQEESEEAESKPQAYYENSEDLRAENEQEGPQDDSKMTRSQLLGRADRDWESPLDLAHSRDASEEPFSGNASSRDSPPGSSMASSTFAHVRKQGVLEEIDSDEFFLREKGISEGEDAEEINRFLVEELRQAFRPQAPNALAGFDMPESPDRPERSPRKPPRKEKDDQPQSYQTFPPERPRRKAPGYVSAYINQQQEEREQDQESQEEERGSDLADYDEDGMPVLKEDVELLHQELHDRELGETNGYEDDGRYEPINEEPVKPVRAKKGQRKPPPTTPVYYNTVAGNEWMRDVEDQIEILEEASSPKPPQRERRKSSRSNQFSEVSETPAVEDTSVHGESQQITGAESDARFTTSEADPDDGFEYVDEAGYAVVHKDRDVPRTAPRRKKKSGSKGSLKRQSPDQQRSEEATGSEQMFFSLPRQAPKTSFHVTPPSRPQRNYSTLTPRRPPRNKSSPRPDRRNVAEASGAGGDSSRPSTAIGIMQGRPLPPPPRPERSPIPMNDLDMTSIERSVGARHYANFDDGSDAGAREVVEEVFIATNIPVLGRQTESSAVTSSALADDDDITIGIQTDPLHEEPSIEAVTRSVAVDSSRVQRQSDSLNTTTTASDDRATRTERPKSPVPPREDAFSSGATPQFVFPRRLHLDELEVDILRVNDLSANSINVQHLSAPHLQVHSLTATGSLSVASIHTQTLNADQVNCNRLSSDTVDLPSIPPVSFHQLSSPDDEPAAQPTQPSTEPPEELRLNAAEKDDAENESSFPYMERELYGNNLDRDQIKEDPSDKYDDSALIGDISDPDLKFSVDDTPEGEDFAQYTPQHSSTLPDDAIKSEEASNALEDLNIPLEELPIERETFRSSAIDLMNEEYLEQPEVDFSPVKEEEKFVSSQDAEFERLYRSSSPSDLCTIPNIDPNGSLEDEILEANIQISYTLPNENVQQSGSEGGSIDIADEEHVPISLVQIEPSEGEEEEEESVVQVKVTLRDLIDQGGSSLCSPRQVPTSSQPEPEIEEIQAPQRVIREPSPPTPILEVQVPVARVVAAPPPPIIPPRQQTPPRPSIATPQVAASPVAQASRQTEPEDIIQLGIRLGRALTRLTMRGLQAMIDYVDTATSDDPSKAEQQKANLQVLLCVILMVVAALMLSSRSGPSFNRWEFYMPPPEL